MTLTFKQLVVEGLQLTPPPTRRSFWIQSASGLVLAAALLVFLAVVANDVPWMLMGALIVLTLVLQALLVVWRFGAPRGRHQPRRS